MIKGFRDFLLRGNVVDLAVAVIIGTAFGAVVKSFSDDFVGGLLGVIGGTPDFGKAGWKVNGSTLIYGTTLTALINFVVVAAVIYFVLVIPMNKLLEMRKKNEVPEVAATPEDIALLQEIRDLLRDRPVS